MDLALNLDPNSGTFRDLSLTASNDLATVDLAAGTKQDILTALRVYLGEWFLDTTVGVPYYQTIFVKNPDQALVNAAFINTISKVPGVIAITAFSTTTNSLTRLMEISFTVRTTSGIIDYSGFL